jgi:hypothetical protein
MFSNLNRTLIVLLFLLQMRGLFSQQDFSTTERYVYITIHQKLEIIRNSRGKYENRIKIKLTLLCNVKTYIKMYLNFRGIKFN